MFIPPRILICGAFSTGKTTFVQAAERRLRVLGTRTAICSDVARSCPFPLNRRQTTETTMWLAANQVRSEIEAQAKDVDVILCDRGLPDILSHHLVDAPSRADALMDAFVAYGRAWSSTYAVIFWSRFDAGRSIVPDGLREADETYRRDLEEALRDVLLGVTVNVVQLPHELDARLRMFERHLPGKRR